MPVWSGCLYENVLEHPILKTLIFVIRVDIPFSIWYNELYSYSTYFSTVRQREMEQKLCWINQPAAFPQYIRRSRPSFTCAWGRSMSWICMILRIYIFIIALRLECVCQGTGFVVSMAGNIHSKPGMFKSFFRTWITCIVAIHRLP